MAKASAIGVSQVVLLMSFAIMLLVGVRLQDGDMDGDCDPDAQVCLYPILPPPSIVELDLIPDASLCDTSVGLL